VTPSKRSAPRIPFGRLLEEGLLQPGDTLYLNRNGHAAKVAGDGTLRSGELSGSIHAVGAALLGVPTLNGWEHWFYRDSASGELLAIDNLREKLRGERKT
jgi:modification methylase